MRLQVLEDGLSSVATLTNQQAACYLKQAGWPENLIPIMVAIGHPESGLRTDAVNHQGIDAAGGPGPYHATGWLQVVDFPDRTAKWNLQDALQNAQAALQVYLSQGLAAWSTYSDNSYQEYMSAVRKDLEGMDYSQCGSSSTQSSSIPLKAGSGLLKGKQADPWGIGQGITDAVGYTGSVMGGIGRTFENAGTLLVGVIVIAAGVGILGFLFLNNTNIGSGIKKAGKDVGIAAVVVPK